MPTKRMAAVALAALLATALPAYAEAGKDRGRMHEGPMQHLMDQLKLTPEQRGKLETIRARQHEQTKAQRDELFRKRGELFELIRSARSTRDQAVAKQREVDALQTRLAESRLAAWYESRAVLTPEQLTQLEKLPMGKGPKGWHRRGKDGN